ncbi:MAG: complex I NDUFA9 subunit family protein [Gammaproteobacteria bacterium]|nr:complex I NDUFA9 subunit family protein [Gammaproteobacteria bacterium]
MSIKNICILGGSGFVGTHLASQLCGEGKSIRVITRRRDHCNHLMVLPNIDIIEANIHDQQVLEQQFKGMDAVINLVGILNERQHNGDGFRQIHIELPRKILNACHHNKVPRVLHMGALNADANSSPSNYLRTKGEGENHIHAFAGKINVTSFRPSVIFGEDDSFVNRFAGILKMTPLMFPLACSYTRFAPVYVNDVAHQFASALEDKTSYGKRIDLCGPKEYTLKQLAEYIATNMGLKTKIIPLPDIFAQIQAHIFEWVPGKPFSLDNFQTLQVDSICQNGIRMPTTIESILPYTLGNKKQQSILDKQRQQACR